jgi:putative SOS response-associated peptidase YedK
LSNCTITELVAFVGRWKDPSGNTAETCAILTTTPNALTSAVHGRMPVILPRETFAHRKPEDV